MGKLSPEEQALRRRVAAWLRHYHAIYEPHDRTRRRFAERAHISSSTITDILNGRDDVGVGLSVLRKMREHLRADLNLVIEEDPPARESTAVVAHHDARAMRKSAASGRET
jgi:transcriptional regulator with XRE-family HTH domain